MITNLLVNGHNLEVEYNLEITPVYLGDLESSYIEIDLINVICNSPVWENGVESIKPVNILFLIKMFELEETLKLIIQGKFEDIE
jgi:hypothetical protein